MCDLGSLEEACLRAILTSLGDVDRANQAEKIYHTVV